MGKLIRMPVKRISVSDLRRQAEELVRNGQMPSLDAVLAAIAETRKEYRRSQKTEKELETTQEQVQQELELAEKRRSYHRSRRNKCDTGARTRW
jgi:multidrug efflux pump subunit AcrA (membrane-fusion protein)